MSSETNETRTRILKAAWQLLEANDGHGVRLADIAKQAGISRQAIYLHFTKRSELLIATTRYIDEVKNVAERLLPTRMANTGIERLHALIDAWANYMPEIYPVAKALLAMKDSDEAAALAWQDRMLALRYECAAVIKVLQQERQLRSQLSVEQATDLMWTLLSIRNWEQFTLECQWSQDQYRQSMKTLLRRLLTHDV